jgi:hypothetical protein
MFYVLYAFVTHLLTLPRINLTSNTEFGLVKLTTTYFCQQKFAVIKTARLHRLD